MIVSERDAHSNWAMRMSAAHFSLYGYNLARITTRRLKPALLEGLRQQRKLYAAADGVDPLGTDADAVAESPDVAGMRASSPGLFLLPLFL